MHKEGHRAQIQLQSLRLHVGLKSGAQAGMDFSFGIHENSLNLNNLLHFLLPPYLSTSAQSSWDLSGKEDNTLTLCRILAGRRQTGWRNGQQPGQDMGSEESNQNGPVGEKGIVRQGKARKKRSISLQMCLGPHPNRNHAP